MPEVLKKLIYEISEAIGDKSSSHTYFPGPTKINCFKQSFSCKIFQGCANGQGLCSHAIHQYWSVITTFD